jgi:hypothetical protein
MLYCCIRTDVPDTPAPTEGVEHFPCCTAGETGHCHLLCPFFDLPPQQPLKTLMVCLCAMSYQNRARTHTQVHSARRRSGQVVFNAKGSGDSSELNILLPPEQVGCVPSTMPLQVP